MTPTTILLVDDDPVDLQLFTRALKHAGYRPISAVVGDTGMVFPEHENPALVLLDYRFSSVLRAPDLARLIRSNYPSAHLLLLSSLPSLPAEMDRLVDGFISKNSPENIVRNVDEWLKPPAA